MSTSESSIHNYSLTGTESKVILSQALRYLKPHLPVSLPLYRRLQFGRFFDATCLLTNLRLDSSVSELDHASAEEWLIAFVDRSCRPETEVWLAASWEVETGSTEGKNRDTLVRDLVIAMKTLPIPLSIHQHVLDAQIAALNNDSEKDHGGLSRRDYGGHAVNPNIMLWGSVHEKTVEVMKRLGLLTFQFKAALVPNFTFIWDVSSLSSNGRDLPGGLRWGELQLKDFELVRSRTQIPRQDRTLSILPNLGIFPSDSDSPISWAFVGLDASLTTLHVESEWRGRGLAKAITTKLFREKMDMFWEDDVKKYAHGYVIVGNRESEGMCKSLHGKSDWEVFWLRVDLGLA